MGLIDYILTMNCMANSLKALQDQTIKGDLNLEIEGLFLYQDRFIVPNIDNLQTKLIHEAYYQVFIAHFGLVNKLEL